MVLVFSRDRVVRLGSVWDILSQLPEPGAGYLRMVPVTFECLKAAFDVSGRLGVTWIFRDVSRSHRVTFVPVRVFTVFSDTSLWMILINSRQLGMLLEQRAFTFQLSQVRSEE